MMLCHFITPQKILCPVKGTTKQEVLTELVQFLARTHELKDPARVLQAILSREQASSTFLPIGIALPHARIEDIDDIQMVLGIHPEGIRERKDGDAAPVQVFCLFLSPLGDTEFGRHLKLLAWMAKVFHDPKRVQALAAAKDAAAAFALLQQLERATHSTQSAASHP